ncbi:MAG: ElyC/SanA/YdcF family protein [Bacteroidota bacterium]
MQKILRLKSFWFILLISIVAFIFICNYVIEKTASKNIYSDISKIPYNKVALVLGTSKETSKGYTNYFFSYRIEATLALYKAGKIKYIIVSGDNHIKGYDEPNDMKKALVERGVPGNIIYLDYAGFRTFDSIIRCLEVFGESNITIVSQKFHNERALYIAKSKGLHAIAFNAQEVSKSFGLGTLIREKFARIKCVIDLYILPAKPHFLGSKIIIPE